MIRKLFLIVLILTAAVLSQGQTNKPAAPGPAEPPKGGEELAALERTWAEAVKRHDIEAIDRIQAGEFVFTGPTGQVWTKAEALDSIRAGDLEIDSFELSNVNIRQYSNTAVVTFRVVWNGRFRGMDISGPQRMTDVFVKRDGRWQCVASHATRIQNP